MGIGVVPHAAFAAGKGGKQTLRSGSGGHNATNMRRVAIAALAISLVGCAPPYVWDDAQRVEERLLRMVPLGSQSVRLTATAKQRGWEIDRRNIYRSPAGSKTYFDDTHLVCRSKGGLVVPVIIDRYSAPFTTTVESMWLFDPSGRLRDVCVRKTVDAL